MSEGQLEESEGQLKGPEGHPVWSEGQPGGNRLRNGQMNVISPHSTRLRPLLGPLPKKEVKKK